MLGFGFVYSEVAHGGVLRSRGRLGRLPLNNAELQPGRVEAPRAEPGVPASARRRQVLGGDEAGGDDDRLLRAAVSAGEFNDPKSEAFLVKALAERRDAILRAYLTAANPIADPALDEDGTLTFRNAAVDADVAQAPRGYRAAWSTFDNATGATRPLGETFASDGSLQAPRSLDHISTGFIKVSIASTGASHSTWETPVDAYFQRRDGRWRLIGFERLPQNDVPSACQRRGHLHFRQKSVKHMTAHTPLDSSTWLRAALSHARPCNSPPTLPHRDAPRGVMRRRHAPNRSSRPCRRRH